MSYGLCNSCNDLVKAVRVERDNQIFLVKDCPRCGITETLISSDSGRYKAKAAMDKDTESLECKLNCLQCKHPQNPGLVFLDITNRCNLNCPICINNTPSMGFLFEPPLDYFEKIFMALAKLEPRPAIQLFGGEPTVRKDLFDIIKMAKRYGLRTRLVTNGLKLADEDYCRELIRLRTTILIAYDGENPETYQVLRGNAKTLDLKKQAIDNLQRIGRAKVTLMTLIARGFNDQEIKDLFQFSHERKDVIRAIYLMPLAHAWDPKTFSLTPDRITTEDLENVVAEVYPDDKIEFLPAGFLGQFSALIKSLGLPPFPFAGAHPNCESMYYLFSDGNTYVPSSRYLRTSAMDVVRALHEANRRMSKYVASNGAPGGFRARVLQIRAILTMARCVGPCFRISRMVKGSGIGKLYHGVMVPIGFILGRKSRVVLSRHTLIQRVLQIIILPFEDRTTLNSECVSRCPAAFAYYDPCGRQGGIGAHMSVAPS